MSVFNSFKKVMLLIGIVASLSVTFVPANVGAINLFEACDANSSKVCQSQNDELQPILKKVINLLLYALGAVAVIVIIISGITFALSNGDSVAITASKNRILYAVIGLVVAIAAYAIVNFVVGSFK